MDGVIRFANEALTGLQTRTTGSQERYTEIWQNVHRQLLQLVEEGKVDASIGQVLQERDEQFQRESRTYDDDVMRQNHAIRDVQNIGNEGSAAMLRAARGNLA